MKKSLLLFWLLMAYIFNAQATQDWTAGLPALSNYNNHTVATDSKGNVYSIGIYNGAVTDFDPGPGVFNMSSISNSMYIVKLDASGVFVWAKQIGGASSYAITSATSIAIDSADNIYISGSTDKIVAFGNLDFDPGAGVVNVSNPVGHYVMYILKLDTNGNHIWNAQFQNPANTSYDLDTIQSMKVDAAGNVYATGGYNGTLDFDPGSGVYNLTSTTSTYSSEIFILKLNSSGSFVWAKSFQNTAPTTGSKIDKGYAVDVDSAGNVYSVGYFWGGIDADPGSSVHSLVGYTSNNPVISGSNVLYVSKLDASGNFVWAYNLVGDHNLQFLPSMAVDSSNNLIISCHAWSNVPALLDFDFGPGTYNLPVNNGSYVFKINSDAGFIWAKATVTDGSQTTNTSQDYSTGLTLDAAGNIYTTGGFHGTRDFDPSAATSNLTSAGNYDAYISKLDTNGNFVWAAKAGGTGLEWGYSLAVSPLGKVTLSGSTDTGFSKSAAAVATGSFLSTYTQPQVSLGTSDNAIEKVSLYPNPTERDLNLRLSNNLEKATAKIYSVSGQMVIQKNNLSGKDFSFDVSHLAKGMYLLQISDGKSSFNSKFIKN